MKWEDLSSAWTKSTSQQPMNLRIADLEYRERTTHRRVRRRDLLETIVAVLLAPIFAATTYFLAREGVWLSSAASLLLTGSCLYIPWRLRKARRMLPTLRPDTPTLDYLRQERDALQAQYQLLNGILGWYLGPLGVGAVLLYAGIRGLSVDTAIYTTAVLALYGVIYLGNRAAARKQIKPLIDEIDQQIAQLEQEK
jgi:hypothetical protein